MKDSNVNNATQNSSKRIKNNKNDKEEAKT